MTEIYNRLKEAVKHATEEGWDGYGAAPVQEISIEYTAKFVENLPEKYIPNIDEDSIGVDPDGEIGIDWYRPDPYRIFSVSIGNNGKFSYAWLFEDDEINKGHGSTVNQDEMIQIVIEKVNSILEG